MGLFYSKKVLDIFPPLCYNGRKGADRPGVIRPGLVLLALVRFGSCFGGFLVGCIRDTRVRIKPTVARVCQVHGFAPFLSFEALRRFGALFYNQLFLIATIFSSAIAKNSRCTGYTSSFSARSRREKMCRRINQRFPKIRCGQSFAGIPGF